MCSGAATGKVFNSSNNPESRPSNFLFQIARGSGATLSECTFFFQKAHITQILQDNSSRPSNFLFQIARGSGATLSECTFSFKKHAPLEDLKKRYMVSLKKSLGRCLFLLDKT